MALLKENMTPDLFEMCYWYHFQNEHLFKKQNKKPPSCLMLSFSPPFSVQNKVSLWKLVSTTDKMYFFCQAELSQHF